MSFRPLNADAAPPALISTINNFRGLFPGDASAPTESETFLLEKMASGNTKTSSGSDFGEIRRALNVTHLHGDVSAAIAPVTPTSSTSSLPPPVPGAPKKSVKPKVRRNIMIEESAEEASSDDEDLQNEEDDEMEDDEEDDVEEEEEEDDDVDDDEEMSSGDKNPVAKVDDDVDVAQLRSTRRRRSTLDRFAVDEQMMEPDSSPKRTKFQEDDEVVAEMTPEEILRSTIETLAGDHDDELLVVSAKHLQGPDDVAFAVTTPLARALTLVVNSIASGAQTSLSKSENANRQKGLIHPARARIGAFFCADAWDPNNFCKQLFTIYPELVDGWDASQVLEYLATLLRATFVSIRTLTEHPAFAMGVLHATSPHELAGIQFRRPADGLLHWALSDAAPHLALAFRPKWCDANSSQLSYTKLAWELDTGPDGLMWKIISVVFEPHQVTKTRMLNNSFLIDLYDPRRTAIKNEGAQSDTEAPSVTEVPQEDDDDCYLAD